MIPARRMGKGRLAQAVAGADHSLRASGDPLRGQRPHVLRGVPEPRMRSASRDEEDSDPGVRDQQDGAPSLLPQAKQVYREWEPSAMTSFRKIPENQPAPSCWTATATGSRGPEKSVRKRDAGETCVSTAGGERPTRPQPGKRRSAMDGCPRWSSGRTARRAGRFGVVSTSRRGPVGGSDHGSEGCPGQPPPRHLRRRQRKPAASHHRFRCRWSSSATRQGEISIES